MTTAPLLEIKLERAGAALKQEQFHKVSENFKLLDRDKDGKLTPQEVGILFRAFGQNPTDEELAEMLKSVPSEGIDIDDFVQFFTGNYKHPTTEDTLTKAFQVFDLEDTGIMNAAKFKEMLTSLGEPMPPAEVDAILKEAEIDEKGHFDYSKLAARLVQGPKRVPGM
eukprot:gnl/TRDRNA2_/TRDRNA2_183720_c0_seq1.p1 gnl/TRDRNA2_/TRDRNA2_183720_c0~~gnl/TRDRNA2_/TRDRNA2_183720_c0_seq1.p1  ORF type:complete len:185 (-),score=55.29 gnl/TRDRNA2_/TRDRNA2_183720_c0_seq1:157-657(-)